MQLYFYWLIIPLNLIYPLPVVPVENLVNFQTHSQILLGIPPTSPNNVFSSLHQLKVMTSLYGYLGRVVYFLVPFFSLTERIEEKQSMHILYSVTNVFQLLKNFLCCLGHNVEEILLGLLKSAFSYHVASNFTKYTPVSLNFIEFFFNSRLCYFLIYLFYLRISTNLKEKVNGSYSNIGYFSYD